MTSERAKPAPKPGKVGRELWRTVTAVYELDERELVVLAHAGRVADLVNELDRVVATEGVMVDGRLGLKVSKAAVEARQQRVVLARLLRSIDLPDDDESSVTFTSRRAAKAALVRWDRVRRDRGEASAG
jgi:hypothetical protein